MRCSSTSGCSTPPNALERDPEWPRRRRRRPIARVRPMTLIRKDIPVRDRLIFALDVADADAARAAGRAARRLGRLLQDRSRALHVGRLLRAARMAGAPRQEGVRRSQVLRRARDRRCGGEPAAEPRRHVHDRARQPGDHGGRRRGEGRRQGARGDRADEPRSRRPRRPGFRSATSASSCCRAHVARSKRVATVWCRRVSRRRGCASTSISDCSS